MTSALDVQDLQVTFDDGHRRVRAVNGVGFRLAPGETLGIVGESGSGKSTTALALMRMLPGTGRITGGSVRLDGTDLTTADEEWLRGARGAKIAMIFQDPMTALNPVLSIGRHLDEAMRAHGRGDRAARARRTVELLDLVGIPDAARRLRDYPHQFSGGMRQRVMIALALANEPDVLLADEPTTALDATVQDQILRLLDRVNRETGTAVVLITHNMGVVARACRRTLVMYGGTVVEDGPTETVLRHPRHPYTAGLLAAVPRLDAPSGTRLHSIPGTPPDLSRPLSGCPFAARCPLVEDRCHAAAPPLTSHADGVRTACFVTAEAVGARELVTVGTGTAEAVETAGPARSNGHGPAGGAGEARRGPAGEATGGERPGPDAGPPVPVPVPVSVPAAREPHPSETALLDVTGLRKTFPVRGRGGRRRPFVALDGVELSLAAGETLGVVGESGSGKSTLARTIVRAHPATSGAVRFRGRDVTGASGAALKELRREVQMVFQDPYASLNPRMTVGRVIAEPLIAHGIGDRADRPERVAALLAQVGIDPDAADRYPRDFSGGQRQRIGIARALAPEPSVLICDEPVSALDVSVQAQVVNLLTDLQRRLGLAMIFIAHDLAVVRQVSHRIAVMHQGRIVETGPADDICERPRHDYTRTLLAAAPVIA
ncbi:ABC transporter ATP-binding protein [Streptomyces sp. NBC_01803]|uniref:ABC transporter ATP-binding protein n=1 Tax=Streptomyces sp. NBC_01803 TaxID=2975946 RepID=UPI002DDB023F|nr:ABC transporter ATP-binding protein [Streptomyces sp. NBC_01803]WSA43476.1 ABC transporter ATP-binding protein [Streptomyces sp. NBC_01803]